MRSSHEKSRIQHRKLRGIIESQEDRLPVQGIKGEKKEISNPESQKIIPTQKKKSQEEISRIGGSFQTKNPRTLTQLLTNSCLPGTLTELLTDKTWDSDPTCVYLGLYLISSGVYSDS